MKKSGVLSQIVLTVVGVLLLAVAGTVAAAETASLNVVVVDARSRAPLPLAAVEIYGPRSLRGSSGIDGVVPFGDSPAGLYELVVRHDGFASKTLHGVALTTGQAATITVELERIPPQRPSWLREIGRTKSKTSSKASSTQVSVDSTKAQISSSVLDAATVLPSVVRQIDGRGETVSLFGHQANQTSVSIEGVPVSAFGSATNLRGFSLDLFQSVQVDHRSVVSSSGGNINFDTRNPALDWIGATNAVRASYGNNGLTFTEAGTAGRLGISVAHARRDEGNPLNGQRFLDASGVDYVHDALTTTNGDAFKIRYPFSQNHIIVGSFVGLDSSSPLFCTQFTGLVPCGYGPRNFENSGLASSQVRDTFAAGRLNASVSLFHNDSNLDIDQSGRFIGGLATPQYSSAKTRANGAIVNGQYQVGRGYPIDFKFTADNQTTSSGGNAFGSIVQPVSSSVNFRDTSVSGQIFARRRFSSTLTIGAQQQGGHSSTTGEISVRFRPSSSDTVTLDSRTGFLNVPPISFDGVADAETLNVNCSAHTAVGFGPSSGSSDSSNSTTTLSLEHSGRKISVVASIRHEVDRNGPLTAIVKGTDLSSTYFSPAYLSAAARTFASTCGGLAAVSPSDLFYGVTAAVPRVVYDGGEATFHIDASRNLAIDISYGATFARAVGSGGPIFSPASTVISGRQLPNQPNGTASLGVTAGFGRGDIRALGNLHYVGGNNPNNLPAYATLDAGIDARLKHNAHLTFGIINATGAHGGTFATSLGSVALPTSVGAFQTIAQPLAPRTVSLSLRLPFGIGASLDDVPDFDAGPSVYGYRLYPYPKDTSTDPFAIDRRSGRCGPESASSGKHYLGIVQQFVARVESTKSQTGSYPAAMPTETREGVKLTYHRNADSFVVIVSLDQSLSFQERLPIARPLAGCSRFYSGSLPDTRNRKLYIPSYDEQQMLLPLAEYAPSVGFYVAPSLIENDSFFPDYIDPPTAAPTDPYAVSNGGECTPNVRSGASAFVSIVKPYIDRFYAGEKDLYPPQGFKITASAGDGPRWLIIESPDLSVKLLSKCLQIVQADQPTLDRLHIGGTAGQSIDFFPQLGFYNK